MLKALTAAQPRIRLAALGAVRVRGADTISFLQGQLSNDIALLSPERPLLAGLHNAQGRVIAVLRLISIAPDDALAVLPLELATPVAARLAKYVLRAKVRVTDESAQWDVFGVTSVEDGTPRLRARISEAPARWLEVAPASPGVDADADPAHLTQWNLADIAAGIPQVYPATSEQFVAQMLNLDGVGGISFTKGCYTGQEVIARAHYRGRVKRRMQRFRTLAAASFAPGDTGSLRDGRSFRVVMAERLEDERCEFLAVTPIAAGEPEGTDGSPAMEVESLELPYQLPD